MAYALVAGQVGCFTLVIVFVALLVGIWLDSQIGRKGPFTVGLLLLSIPISLFVMVRIALGSVHMIQPPPRSANSDQPQKHAQSQSHTKEE